MRFPLFYDENRDTSDAHLDALDDKRTERLRDEQMSCSHPLTVNRTCKTCGAYVPSRIEESK